MYEELIAQMIEELHHAAPLHVTLGAHPALIVALALKRVAKLRDVSPDARRALVTVIEHIRLHFREYPAVTEGIERGIDVDHVIKHP